MKNHYPRHLTLLALPCLFALNMAAQNLTLTTQVTPVLCNGGCNGAIDLTVTGGIIPYTHLWTNGATTQDISNLCPGNYCVTVTDANGTTATICAEITQPPPMTLTICVTPVSCFGGSNGALDLTVAGGVPGYTYVWSNGNTTQDLNGVGAGTYSPTVTNANGCTKSASATVPQPADIILSATVNNSTGNEANGSIDLTVGGGMPPYTYSWSNGSITPDPISLVAGSYCVTVTDAHACSSTYCATVNNDNSGPGNTNPMTLNAQVTNSGCGVNCTGSITVNIFNGLPPFSYSLSVSGGPSIFTSVPSTNFVINQLCAGTYCLTLYSANNTETNACYTIGQGQSQLLDIQSTNSAFCNYDPGGSSVCEKVCPHMAAIYFVEPPANCGVPTSLQNTTWTISGADSYLVSPDKTEVSVVWGETGAGLIKLEGNSSGLTGLCFQSTHCVNIVEEPEAKFVSNPPAPPNAALQVCKGQNVQFQNQSLHADVLEWQFGDDHSMLEEENPAHTFLTPGTFSVRLIARSHCLCADTMTLLVEVLDTEPPLLDCVGSVCPGEAVTYSTSSNCSAYMWVVSANGTVQSGGQSSDNHITIQWNSGPQGSIALSAQNCGGATCPQASVFYIPIISDDAEIRGPEVVCSGSEEEYSIEPFDGTDFVWSLGSGGSIVSGQGTHQVSVIWTGQALSSATHWLSVKYNNCYLGCGGQDSIPVKILPPFFIAGPVEMCENATQNFRTTTAFTNSLLPCNWTIYGPDGMIVMTYSGWYFDFVPPAGPGSYRLFAVPINANQTCSASAELTVKVAARPPAPVGIAGPVLICPGTPYTYSVPGNPAYELQWTMINSQSGGAIPQMGNPLNVTWANIGPRILSVAQVSVDGLGCLSDTVQLNVQPLPALTVTGTPQNCVGTVGTYSTDLFQNVDYQWQIIPSNAGTIKSGQGKNVLEIFWQAPGNHKVRVTRCGMSASFSVIIHPDPEPIPTHPVGLCPNSTGIATAGATYNSYIWKSEAGTVFGNNALTTVTSGTYVLAVTDVNGCKGTTPFTVEKYPAPNVTVSTTDPTGFCNNSRYVSITALVPDEGNFDYEWFRNGLSLGVNAPVYATNQYGNYSATVTNEYGCTASDGSVHVFESCIAVVHDPSQGPACLAGDVTLHYDPTSRCDSFQFHLNTAGQYQAGSAFWQFGKSGNNYLGSSTDENPGMVFPNAGKYIVILTAYLLNGAKCTLIDSVDVAVAAQFSQVLACPGDSTQFTDASTRLPDADIASWHWDFGEIGTSDTSNVNSPGHPYTSAGTYLATLTITSTSGCTSSQSQNVFVPNLPAPGFASPSASCVDNATEFSFIPSADFVDVHWDFGDPASANLNQSAAELAYHHFNPAGTYMVGLTATNLYGCVDTFSQPVVITPNPFSGEISPLGTSMICAGKTITLTAPTATGATYSWSNASVLTSITVDQEGVYDVTLTDASGCTYSPSAKSVEVNPAPVGVIKSLDINDLGQVVGVSYPNTEVCAGEDVTLQVFDNGNFSALWSDGTTTSNTLAFLIDQHNLLDVGNYTYTVTLTNPATGCTAITTPFEVVVNPLPTGFSLSANNVCAGSPNTISYFGPQPPEWQILWNTGETGATPLTTEEAGLYFVRVVNEYGCVEQSNTVVIFPGPNIAALPAGCHSRCAPDTLCLPALPDIVSWQWYFENAPIAGATSGQLVAEQSGTYWAALTDINGCAAQSALLTLELEAGSGDILGQVWSDVNDNGVIDAADTLLAGMPVRLLQNNTQINSNQSNTTGGFDFLNIPSTAYLVQVDTQNLPSHWQVVIGEDPVTLLGCDVQGYADLLLHFDCVSSANTISLAACAGATALYNGQSITAGQTEVFHFTNFLGCDSMVNVTVSTLPMSTSILNATTCPGTTFNYNGTNLSIGQSQNFLFQNYLGCDSTVTVTVSALPMSTSTLNATTCPGTTFNYNGTDLTIGQSQNFLFQNYLGCDSTVTVTVSALPMSTSTLNATTCPGTTFNYNGTDLAVGQSQNFLFQNYLGCDSTVTVTVSALPMSTSTLNVTTCLGTTFQYAGTNLAIGQTQNFVFQNYLGCDSMVTVTVSALPISVSGLTVATCPGTTFQYAGIDLAIGQSQNFVFQNYLGCDSTVIVIVRALPTSTSAVTVGICPGETYEYEGTTLTAGAIQDFTFVNAVGCDSVVTVTISEKAVSSERREVQVCPGENYVFNGVALAPGEVQDFHFSGWEGCDSTITIAVTAWPELNFVVETEISCPTVPTGSLSVQVASGGSLASGFSLDNVDFQTNTFFESLATGNYAVFVQDENGCVFERAATIEASPRLEVELPAAFLIPCDSAAITLTPAITGDTAGLHFIWSNGAQSATVAVSEGGPIWVEATNHCETVRREASVAWADLADNEDFVYVPNVFSPDAEMEVNRSFRSFFARNIQLLDYHIEVYDRWGNFLFVSEVPEDGWGSLFLQKNMYPGVYVWHLWAHIGFCGRVLELRRKGDVTVVR